MNRESVLRCSLWFAAAFNIGGAILFAFPETYFGQLAGLPEVVPLIYRVFVAFFILLFAGAFVWMAVRKSIVTPLIAFAAVGKTSAFALTMILWFAGQVPWRSIVAVSGDLILAAIFTLCIVGSQRSAGDQRAASPVR